MRALEVLLLLFSIRTTLSQSSQSFYHLLSHTLPLRKPHFPQGSASDPGIPGSLPVIISPATLHLRQGLGHTLALATPHDSSLCNVWHLSELFHASSFISPITVMVA